MIVSELIAALEGINPSATVLLWCASNPDKGGKAVGDIVYVSIGHVDGTDRTVILANCVDDKHGNHVFDAPPQIRRFSVSNSGGRAAAIAGLTEQLGCEPTQDLRDELEKDKLREIFRSFKDLLNQVQTNKENPDV